ncbi:MAG TPA: BBP7 family outer membrane beta-barrel protein [Gemmatales bacterium]|nr:BBP7 family outer membrane beta-barrel protein [Gemmatales bacterium]
MTPVCRAATLSLAASCWLASLTFAQDTAAVPPGASAAPAPLMTPIVQSGLDVDGTAFHYQPSAFVSELCDPLAPICCEPPRFWVGAEYLLWTIRPGPLPVPVATTSTLIPPPVTGAVGRLGEPGTVVVLGNQDLNYGTFSGLRMNVGYLISPSAGISLEGSGFFLERRTDDNFAVTDDQGNNLLAIPVVNVLSGNEGRAIYGFPGEFIGGIGISSGSRLWSAETNAALLGIAERGAWRFDLLAGFRYADLNENVGIGASTFIIGQGFLSTYRDIQLFPGDTIITQDNFRARNQFYGGQIGLRAETTFGRFFLQGVAKTPLGGTRQRLEIDGLTTVVASGVVLQDQGGVFASPTNIGSYSRSQFSVLPEAGVTLGWQLNEAVRVGVGYTFLYWTNVARPGEQIDRVINPTFLPTTRDFSVTPFGPIRPLPTGDRSDFWAQGINFSLEVRF